MVEVHVLRSIGKIVRGVTKSRYSRDADSDDVTIDMDEINMTQRVLMMIEEVVRNMAMGWQISSGSSVSRYLLMTGGEMVVLKSRESSS